MCSKIFHNVWVTASDSLLSGTDKLVHTCDGGWSWVILITNNVKGSPSLLVDDKAVQRNQERSTATKRCSQWMNHLWGVDEVTKYSCSGKLGNKYCNKKMQPVNMTIDIVADQAIIFSLTSQLKAAFFCNLSDNPGMTTNCSTQTWGKNFDNLVRFATWWSLSYHKAPHLSIWKMDDVCHSC